MIYKFQRDKKVLFMSVFAMVIVPIAFYAAWLAEGDAKALYAIPLWLVLMIGIVLRTPRYYHIEEQRIVVQFFVGSKVLCDIHSVRRITEEERRSLVRIWGNGGFVAYTGIYKSRLIGRVRMYAVNKDNLALVTLDNGKQYVINYPEELLKRSSER